MTPTLDLLHSKRNYEEPISTEKVVALTVRNVNCIYIVEHMKPRTTLKWQDAGPKP